MDKHRPLVTRGASFRFIAPSTIDQSKQVGRNFATLNHSSRAVLIAHLVTKGAICLLASAITTTKMSPIIAVEDWHHLTCSLKRGTDCAP